MHVTTTVHLPAARLPFHEGDVDDALEGILDTFDANGDEPPARRRRRPSAVTLRRRTPRA